MGSSAGWKTGWLEPLCMSVCILPVILCMFYVCMMMLFMCLWCCDSQKQLDIEPFGPNLADVEKQIAAHNILHQAIQSYSTQLTPDSITSKVRTHINTTTRFGSYMSQGEFTFSFLFLRHLMVRHAYLFCTLVLWLIYYQDITSKSQQ